MVLEIYNGMVNLGGNTDVLVSGIGFSGKAFIFYAVNHRHRDGTYSGNYYYSLGFATASGGGYENSATSAMSTDDVSISITASRLVGAGACIMFVNDSGFPSTNYVVSGVDGNSFLLDVQNYDGSIAASGAVGFTVFGGDDLTNYNIVGITSQSGHGSASLFGGGLFSSGNVIFMIGGGTSGGGNNVQGSFLTLGMATDSGDQQSCVSVMSEHDVDNSDTWRWQRTDRIFGRMDAAGAMVSQIAFEGFTESGFKINWISGDQHSNVGMISLVMKISGNANVVSWNTISGTGNQDISGVGFSGKYAFFMSTDTACNNIGGSSGQNRLSIGSAMSSANRGAMWAGDRDALSTMANARTNRDDACFVAAFEHNTTPSQTSGTMIADFVEFNADGFTINKSVNAFNGDTSGMTISTLVIGDVMIAEAGGPTLPGINIRPMAFGGGRNPANYNIPNNPIFGY